MVTSFSNEGAKSPQAKYKIATVMISIVIPEMILVGSHIAV